MAILTKAAPVLQVENFVDMMPVAWELLLETDQELAAAAGKLTNFVVLFLLLSLSWKADGEVHLRRDGVETPFVPAFVSCAVE